MKQSKTLDINFICQQSNILSNLLYQFSMSILLILIFNNRYRTDQCNVRIFFSVLLCFIQLFPQPWPCFSFQWTTYFLYIFISYMNIILLTIYMICIQLWLPVWFYCFWLCFTNLVLTTLRLTKLDKKNSNLS